MEAIVATSRSVNNDQFIQKDQRDKLKKHHLMVRSIVQNKQDPFPKVYEHEIKTMESTFHKSKSAARFFQRQEESSHLKK